MRRTEPLLMLVFAVCVCVSPSVRGSTTIVVNVGAHPSAQVAGRSEADVNWLDADTTDDYRLISVNGGRRITLVAGGGRAGTLYGAYDLLYRLGCRWFAPGETHEETPPIAGIADLDVSEQPSFHTRGFHAWEDRADPQFLIWMARNRLNYWCVEQSNHPLLHKLGIQMSCAEHTAQSYFLDPASPYPYDHHPVPGGQRQAR